MATLSIAMLIISAVFGGQANAVPDPDGTGIVLGSKGSYEIEAPEGWVLENPSEASKGKHCRLYPSGSTWKESEVVMYAKLAVAEYESRDAFVEYSLDFFKKDDSDFQHRVRARGSTSGGHEYLLLEYYRPSYPLFERAVYVQLPQAVAFIVFSAKNWDIYLETSSALEAVIDSFRYLPVE